MVAEAAVLLRAPGECEDCGAEVEGGVEPIGLFREVPGALADRVYDVTKGKWVRRSRQTSRDGKRYRVARHGGRRWREYLLCRRCRADALRQRAAKGGTVMENGHKRGLKTRERVAPKKGGRPRLLNDDELAVLYRLYELRGWSIGEIASRLDAARDKGTRSGYYQSILYGWRRLGYTLRPKGVQIGMSRFGTDGTKSKPRKQRCVGAVIRGERKGRRCREFAMRDSRYCVGHQQQANDGRVHYGARRY